MTTEQAAEILGPDVVAQAAALAAAHGPLTAAQIAVLVPLLEAPVSTERSQAA